MMIRMAGGPGLAAPIDFGERKPRRPVWLWIAVGASAVAHVGAGALLYSQRFAPSEAPAAPVEPRTFDVEFRRPPPPPAKATPRPAAPNPPLHRTPAPTAAVETLPAPTPIEAPGPVPGPVINLVSPAPAGASGSATETTPPVRAAPTIAHPRWTRRPTADQLMRAYPGGALAAGRTGSASIDCQVRVDGTLTGCSVVSQTPEGWGFGRAAVALSRHFRMSPRTVDGAAVDGAQVSVALRFTLPED